MRPVEHGVGDEVREVVGVGGREGGGFGRVGGRARTDVVDGAGRPVDVDDGGGEPGGSGALRRLRREGGEVPAGGCPQGRGAARGGWRVTRGLDRRPRPAGTGGGLRDSPARPVLSGRKPLPRGRGRGPDAGRGCRTRRNIPPATGALLRTQTLGTGRPATFTSVHKPGTRHRRRTRRSTPRATRGISGFRGPGAAGWSGTVAGQRRFPSGSGGRRRGRRERGAGAVRRWGRSVVAEARWEGRGARGHRGRRLPRGAGASGSAAARTVPRPVGGAVALRRDPGAGGTGRRLRCPALSQPAPHGRGRRWRGRLPQVVPRLTLPGRGLAPEHLVGLRDVDRARRRGEPVVQGVARGRGPGVVGGVVVQLPPPVVLVTCGPLPLLAHALDCPPYGPVENGASAKSGGVFRRERRVRRRVG